MRLSYWRYVSFGLTLCFLPAMLAAGPITDCIEVEIPGLDA